MKTFVDKVRLRIGGAHFDPMLEEKWGWIYEETLKHDVENDGYGERSHGGGRSTHNQGFPQFFSSTSSWETSYEYGEKV